MQTIVYKTALIVGAGMGLSAALTRLFTSKGMRVALAARQTDKLAALCKETGAAAYACDATNVDDVARLFTEVERDCGAPEVVVYNASARARGAFVDLVPADVSKAIAVSAFGGFLVAQEAARRMLPTGHGAILFTGASASVKGYPQSAPFAMQVRFARSCTKHGPRIVAPRHPRCAFRDRRRHPQRSADRAAGQARFNARSGCDRRELLGRAEPTAQCLDVRIGIAALGGEILEFHTLHWDIW